jgi:hypothetical protein
VHDLFVVTCNCLVQFIMHSAVAIFFAFNVLFNYVNCVRTDPVSGLR